MTKTHQIKLYPTKAQEVLLRKSCGVARHSYNWALAKWKELHESGNKTGAYLLVKLQNSIKKEEMPFYSEVSKNAPQYAIHNLEHAFKKMWTEKSGYPKFKKKGDKDSFVAIENNNQYTKSNPLVGKIHIPRIGKIKCAENLRFEGKVNNVTVKRIANMWFAYVNIEIETPTEVPTSSKNHATVGIDVGISKMMVLSDGTVYDNPKALKSNLKNLKRLQRGLSRKVKGSNNRRKQQMKVAKKHYRISCIRKNAIHQATTEIVKKYDKIVIEDLNIESMVKNHKLAQALSDVSFGEIIRQLTYKCAWSGKELVKANRYFPSSKLCSNCGNKKEKISLSQRVYKCDNCGFVCDRDLNASKNLAKYSPTPGTGESQVFGESLVETQRTSMKNKTKTKNLFK